MALKRRCPQAGRSPGHERRRGLSVPRCGQVHIVEDPTLIARQRSYVSQGAQPHERTVPLITGEVELDSRLVYIDNVVARSRADIDVVGCGYGSVSSAVRLFPAGTHVLRVVAARTDTDFQ